MIYINDDIETLDMDNAMARISAQRREKVMLMRNERDRRLSVAAYLQLLNALETEYGITAPPHFDFHDGGKPFIAGRRDICFSMSHCRCGVACAVSDRPVGIDIETIRPYRRELAERVMNTEEMDVITSSPHPEIEFIRLWTMKESFLKMTGEGIRSDLKLVPLSSARFTTTINAARGYICTACEMACPSY
ncbi:MAG: 4'-phosphopantetheinyl transferase superfamily protein [Prevotella sp.]|nr:4'-phosphopantetheinyl transferase superfamily protein [Prevotella sp.]MDE6355574.1 4'-phosphopantetheinyl transferase superfamily protein [Prevotella sp.]